MFSLHKENDLFLFLNITNTYIKHYYLAIIVVMFILLPTCTQPHKQSSNLFDLSLCSAILFAKSFVHFHTLIFCEIHCPGSSRCFGLFCILLLAHDSAAFREFLASIKSISDVIASFRNTSHQFSTTPGAYGYSFANIVSCL